MKIDAKDKNAAKYHVYDVDWDCLMGFILSADDETGEYTFMATRNIKFDSGKPFQTFARNEKGDENIRVTSKGNIKILNRDNEEDLKIINRIDPDNELSKVLD